MNFFKLILIIGFLVLTTAGCGGSSENGKQQETAIRGTIHISVDESFKPVIDSQVQVFEALHNEAKILKRQKLPLKMHFRGKMIRI